MSWAAVAGAGVGLLGSAMSSNSNGGAGASSNSKQPWAAATPWLMQNLVQGQALQNQYATQPISARQQTSLNNQYAQSDYMRGLIPGLLQQLQSQPVGFDKKNATARPTAFNFNATGGGLGQNAISSVANAPAVAAAPASQFVQQDMGYSPQQQALVASGRSPWLLGGDASSLASAGGTGSYGAYHYGDNPAPGTQAYRDMQEFFLMGGNDPRGLSQFGVKPPAGLGNLWGGTSSGSGVSSSAPTGNDY